MIKYVYDEPALYNGTCQIIRTEEEVIEYMKNIYKNIYEKMPDDYILINEYILLHWAWRIYDEI